MIRRSRGVCIYETFLIFISGAKRMRQLRELQQNGNLQIPIYMWASSLPMREDLTYATYFIIESVKTSSM